MGLFSDIGTSIGGAIGAAKSKKYSKKAAAAQIKAADKGIGEIQNQWGLTQGYYNPWVTAGTGALGQYSGLMGLQGADAQQAAIDQLQASPYYQSLYRTGEEAVLQNASATGGLRGGNTQRSLADFGADTLSQTIQQYLQNLGPGMQYGSAATGALANAGIGQATDVTNLYLGQGQAKAADYMRRAAATNAMWQGIGGAVGGIGDMAAGAFGMPTGMAGGGGAASGGAYQMPAAPPGLYGPSPFGGN